MAAFSVVVLDPGGKGLGAFLVAQINAAVGPFGGQGPVQALDFPVLPGAVRADEFLPDPVASADLAQRFAVGPGVVGDQPLDAGDAVAGEVADRSVQERCAGGALLISQDLAVGQPGVVID